MRVWVACVYVITALMKSKRPNTGCTYCRAAYFTNHQRQRVSAKAIPSERRTHLPLLLANGRLHNTIALNRD